MVDRDELNNYCDNYLSVSKYKDYGPNGLQVEGSQPINKIVVTEGLSGSKINFDSRIANQGPMGFIIENQLLIVIH